jgi:VanZ family protein
MTTWGIPTHLFLQIHVVISLIALVSGLVALYSWINNKNWNGWTALFLVTIILTSVTGFPLPPFGLDPPRMVGILSLILLAIAVLGIYVFKNAGPWRWIFIIAATAALWFDAFVGVIQAFAKLPSLHELAPNGSEPPFVIVQLIVLAIFVLLGYWALRRFHPNPAKRWP